MTVIDRGGRGRRRDRRRRVGLRGAHRAPPARAARPLLPDARLVRRGGGRRAGDVPAGVAQPRHVRRRLAVPGVALPDRHERLPRHAAPELAAPDDDRTPSPRCRGCSRTPTQLLDEVAPSDEQPDAVVVERETIELAFLAALQVLPPRQRAALIARDVLGWPASETAALLETSVAGGEQRAPAGAGHDAGAPAGAARGVVGRRAERGGAGAAGPVHRRARALRRGGRRRDRGGGPPHHDAAEPVLLRRARRRSRRCSSARSAERDGDWRLVPTLANRMPTAASYLRRPGDSEFRAFKFDVLRVEDGAIAEITTFGAGLFPAFGLPPTL